MADNEQNSAQEKTNNLHRRLDKAREEGKTVTSKEMYICASIIMMLIYMYFIAFIIKVWLVGKVCLLNRGKYGAILIALGSVIKKIIIFTLIIGVPAFILTIFTQMLVGGITFSFKTIEWKNNRLSPISWFKRVFSMKGLVELGKSILKVILLFGAGFYVIYKDTTKIRQVSTETFENAIVTSSSFFPILLITLIIILLLIAILDWSCKIQFLKN